MTIPKSRYAEWVVKAQMEVCLHYLITTRERPNTITNNIRNITSWCKSVLLIQESTRSFQETRRKETLLEPIKIKSLHFSGFCFPFR